MTSERLEEIVPATAAELSRLLQENASGPRRPLWPLGGRTGTGFGFPVAEGSLVVATTRLKAISDYPARDMTVTVEAGCRVDTLQEELAREGQRLPVDIAVSQRATIGGAIAANASGPRRYGLGTLRDYLIGVSCVTASGQPFRAGGRVVKNVAGYDICKLIVGSLGSLAVISEITLKLKPTAEYSAMVWVGFDQGGPVADMLKDLATSAARPVAIELLGPKTARQLAAEARAQLPEAPLVLCVGVEGSELEVRWQVGELERELRAGGARSLDWVTAEDLTRLWRALTEFSVDVGLPGTFRASLRPSRVVEFVTAAVDAGVTVLAHAGNGVVMGHLPDDTTTAEGALAVLRPLRDLAVAASGQLVIERCDPDWLGSLRMWGDTRSDWGVMQAVKQQLDPEGLLAPGRGIEAALAQVAEGVA